MSIQKFCFVFVAPFFGGGFIFCKYCGRRGMRDFCWRFVSPFYVLCMTAGCHWWIYV